MSKIPLIVIGAGGRMGREVIAAATAAAAASQNEIFAFALAELIERGGSSAVGQEVNNIKISAAVQTKSPAAFIDFSAHGAVSALADKVPDGSVYVLGTTALDDTDRAAIKKMSQRLPVVAAENMSFGITLLATFLERAARVLDESWDIEISESHHKDKKDAPSGTALLLGRAAAAGRGKKLEHVAVYDRHQGASGHGGGRTRGQIGFASTRGGDVVGKHKVSFLRGKEAIGFTHEAFSRDIFAYGALRAAAWGWGKESGLYNLTDVLGIE